MYFPQTTLLDYRKAILTTLLLHLIIVVYRMLDIPSIFTHTSLGIILYASMFAFGLLVNFSQEYINDNVVETVKLPVGSLSIVTVLFFVCFISFRYFEISLGGLEDDLLFILSGLLSFLLVYFSSFYASVILVFPLRFHGKLPD